jgi:hypothetical protein
MASRGQTHVQLGHMPVDADRAAEQGESVVDAAGAGRQVAEAMKRDDIVGVAGQRLEALALCDVAGLGVPVADVAQLAREALGKPAGLTGLAGGASLFPVHSRAAFVPGRSVMHITLALRAAPTRTALQTCEHRRGAPLRC